MNRVERSAHRLDNPTGLFTGCLAEEDRHSGDFVQVDQKIWIVLSVTCVGIFQCFLGGVECSTTIQEGQAAYCQCLGHDSPRTAFNTKRGFSQVISDARITDNLCKTSRVKRGEGKPQVVGSMNTLT